MGWRIAGRPARLSAAALAVALAPASGGGGGAASTRSAREPSAGPWAVLADARLAPGRYADGDSFVLRTPEGEGVYRLYFVDAPECDAEFPDRLAEQARHFGISAAQALEVGRRAAAYSRQRLRDGCVLFTRGEPAEGRGAPRQFALVRCGDRWLHEALVEAGLARVFGRSVDLPDGTSAAVHWRRLREIEAAARAARRGAWGLRRPD